MVGIRSESIHRVTVAVGVAFFAAVCLVTAAPASSRSPATGFAAPSRPTPVADAPDFNGDGFPDVAVGAPNESIGSAYAAGSLTVLYGSTDGISGAGSDRWTKASRGIPGKPETNAEFGNVLAWGDFDGDGYAELAIGVPTDGRDEIGTASGSVTVLRGSADGLTAIGSKTWTLKSRGMPGHPQGTEEFGASLAAADLNADGFDDLAVGADQEDSVRILYGSADGLGAVDIDLLHPFWLDDGFGTAIAPGDFDHDGDLDLAISAPLAEVGDESSAGVVRIFRGTPDGVGRHYSQQWAAGVDGVLGTPFNDDYLGKTLAAGDLNGDSFADLAMGAPSPLGGNPQHAGQVHVLYGTPRGLSAAGNQLWDQDVPGVPGHTEIKSRFGWDLVIADVDADQFVDLIVGAHWDEVHGVIAGSVYVMHGSSEGVTTQGIERWNQASHAVAGRTGDYYDFGFSISAADIGSDGTTDLVVGSLDETIRGSANAGAVHVLLRSPDGATFDRDLRITQATPGVPGHLGANRFGQEVSG